MRSRRIALGALAAVAATVGVWALLAPGSFYSDFPFGRAWVAVDGPFNEHLIRDVGALNLGLAVVAAVAAYRAEPALVRLAAAAALVVGAPHLLYHTLHLDGLAPLDAAMNVVTLGLGVIVPTWLAWSPAPRARSDAAPRRHTAIGADR
ncbi:MAG TPA: hypothetical protein VFZ70_03695 [Euzebyales bacterium]